MYIIYRLSNNSIFSNYGLEKIILKNMTWISLECIYTDNRTLRTNTSLSLHYHNFFINFSCMDSICLLDYYLWGFS